MTQTHIYGAGMAGLLAATVLRRSRPTVHELQPSLPDNHGALLRFRSGAVEAATGQPFRRVRVLKAVKSGGELRDRATLSDANRYSLKVTGRVSPRSVLSLEPCDRWVAPPDFVAAMAAEAEVSFDDGLTLERLEAHRAAGDSVVSTLPMPALMEIAGWGERPEFSWRPIWSARVDLGAAVEVYQTVYYPGDEPHYRASVTGSELIVEFLAEPDGALSSAVHSALCDFGIARGAGGRLIGVKRQEYGKLSPTGREDEEVRQRFIVAMTDRYRAYSVGRFAVWRQILLDDVVLDLEKVARWIAQRNDYRRRLEATP